MAYGMRLLTGEEVNTLHERILSGANENAIVTASWRRCLDDYGMEPSRVKRAEVFSAREFKEKIESHEQLMRGAHHEVEDLFRKLVDNDYIVSMAAPDGLKLSIRCDHHFLGELSGFGVLPGSVWNERHQGTNGIGTALMVGKAVSINGSDHFSDYNKKMSCHAAPIFGHAGLIEGVVNVTSVRHEHERTARLVLDMVRRTAARIEGRNFLLRNVDGRLFSLAHDIHSSTLEEQLHIAVDGAGCITDVTSNFVRFLNTRDRRGLIGRPLEEVIELPRWWADCGTVSKVWMPDGHTTAYFIPVPRARAISAPTQSAAAAPMPPTLPSSAQNGAIARLTEAHNAVLRAAPKDFRAFLHSEQMIRLKKATRVFQAGLPLLLSGETGTGKTGTALELARQIGGRVIQVFCTDPLQLSAARCLIEGHDGQLPLVLLLEGVQDLSTDDQGRLVTFLEQELAIAKTRLHIISTYVEMDAEGSRLQSLRSRLRPDLFARLSGMIIDCAPLRKFPNVIGQVKAVFSDVYGKPVSFSREAEAALANYHWPGNLRELDRVARMTLVFLDPNVADEVQISLEILPEEILGKIRKEDLLARSQSEAARIEAALRYHNGNLSETARYLGVSRSTLYRKVQIAKIR